MDSKLPRKLAKLREDAGLSKRALALAAGVDPAYYGRLEAGEVANPSWQTVCALADALKVSLDSLR